MLGVDWHPIQMGSSDTPNRFERQKPAYATAGQALRSSADLRRSRGGNICLSVMTHRTHCPRSTRHEFEPNTVVSHLALHLIYKDIQVLFTKAFSTMHDMFPSAGEVDHSCPCEGFITHTFRAPPSSHDIVARRPFLCFLGRRESLCRCRGIPRLLSLN